MRILITNDDGIHARGLAVLETIARSLSDDVWIVAPETDQSGVSHSLSLNDPLRLRKISDRHFAVKGTPTDCVIMGVREVVKDHKPDLVLSGVNAGQNVAEDVTYSGTIAAAIEGTILGVPSIALSQGFGPDGREKIIWECAATLAPDVIRKIIAAGIEKGSLVNVNFPNCPSAEVQGVSVTAQGARDQQLLRLDGRIDGRGRPYYWIAFQRSPHTPANGTDLWALAEKKVSVTPLRLDLTDEPMMTRYARAFA